jgi:hypothetical protein
MTTKEYITHEAGNDEAWICICGNSPASDGFYSCDEDGNEVEPTHADWKTDWYVCARCGRMIDVDTLEIVGRNEHPKFLA